MEEVGLFRIIASFAFVIGLILVFSWFSKYIRNSRWVEKVQGERRLKMVEQLFIDAKHKVVLVKCDEEEHLLLMGDGHVISEISKKGAKK